jgi:Cu(I)/Ag(I) efflux system membrane fusion protein
MKPVHLFLLLVVTALAGAGGWFASRHFSGQHTGGANTSASAGRKVLYYQSAMHPWIKSDKPGRCTICGMELIPVYEGEKGFDSVEGVTTLGSNIIQVIHVQSDEVTRRPLRRTLRVAGTIEDDDTKHRFVSAYVEGRIEKLAVNFVGAEVNASQPLATVYSPTLLAAEREYAVLAKQQSAGTNAQFAAEHQRLVEAAAQRLKRLGLSDAQIAALPNKPESDIHTSILAPVSGTVVARFVYEGQYVKEGDKLFELADFSTMWFQFDAYERDLVWIKASQTVEVTTPAAPGLTFTGAVVFIDPNLKEMTRTARVRVELPNPLLEENGRRRRQLYHKLYADALVHVETPEVLAIPRAAVLMPGPQALVYLDKGGGGFEQREVKLGRAGDEDWEVLDGLGEGDKVVTTGNLLIDAQAQLRAGGRSGGSEHRHGETSAHTTPVPLPPLTTAQRDAAKQFLDVAAALASALAADNLGAFNSTAPKAHPAVAALAAAFSKDNPWRPLIGSAESAAHVESAADLKAARKGFHPLSAAAVAFTKRLRALDAEFGSIKVYRCPMTADAFPGAPAAAEWIQTAGPLRNPWFGPEMLECGTEVKPQ